MTSVVSGSLSSFDYLVYMNLNDPTSTSFELSARGDTPALRFEMRAEGLTVVPVSGDAFGAITVDLGSASIERRVAQGRGGLLAKALLPSADQPMPLVWDVTAGLGRDAMTLARLGCEVVAFERHPFLGMLLLDGHRRALQRDDVTGEAARRMTVRVEDAGWALARITEEERRPDAILIDPMFPEGKGKAAVKKDAVLLRMLVGEGAREEEDAALLRASLAMATWRVAVKRPLKAPKIIETPPPQATFKGKSVRVDRYATGV